MKLAVTLALATLALCCRPGPAFASQADPARGLPSWESVADSAESCLDFIVKTFFVSLLSSHEVSVELFSPDADMRDAAIKIKGLVDTLPQQDKDSVRRAMDKIIKKPTLCLGFRS
ncbi:uteroglobin [Myotis yumanensis]|uniref:uteroglobin n=1 Tax=Myotis yumanensis TaxID=159337 RepID=UPI0038D42DA7